MTLSDREVLELNELCSSIVDETLTDSQRERFENRLAESEDAVRFYVEAMALSASLCHHADESQMEAADAPFAFRSAWSISARRLMWAAVAASLVVAGGIWTIGRDSDPESAAPTVAAGPIEFVAKITGEKECRWAEGSPSRRVGDFLRRGQRLDLSQGFAEVTFDSGAVVLLEGPAVLDVNSAWNSMLRRGALTANVPPQAVGFRVSNPAVEVVDLGTEFSMIVDGQGTADVFVLQGEVEAVPTGQEEQDSLLLKANESRRFASTGVSIAADEERMFARFRAPVNLDARREPVSYVHWSFNVLDDGVLAAEVVGFEPQNYDFTLLKRTPAAVASTVTDGFRGRAIRFDGKQVAKAQFPGLSGSFTRTIGFWVKVPENAPLSNSYAMVAWRADSDKLGSRPVHINWNRNPTEGPVGAIRTDFSGGHAMGTTPLRDGRWHHVSIVFVPGDDSEAPVQVKQYVDGRLESNTVTPGPRRSIAGNYKPDEVLAAGDLLWLGCRLGSSGAKRERFVGTIDELFIGDRSLEPSDIVRLMDGRELEAADDAVGSSTNLASSAH